MANDKNACRALALQANTRLGTALLMLDLALEHRANLADGRFLESLREEIMTARDLVRDMYDGATAPKLAGPSLVFDDGKIRARHRLCLKKIQANRVRS